MARGRCLGAWGGGVKGGRGGWARPHEPVVLLSKGPKHQVGLVGPRKGLSSCVLRRELRSLRLFYGYLGRALLPSLRGNTVTLVGLQWFCLA